ncbi:hypothetical protein [Actinomadura macrotermitis]|uniref:hypothetical protein n=1 Tax=Actinomadura macrotermitis TaxID=2585200 RepID=UPI0012971D4E|nr:hypothetical protein [Actinomadura macrotermitis]
MIEQGGVFLPGEVCARLWPVLRAELARLLQDDGGRVRPEVAEAMEALRAAALAHASANGRPGRTCADIPSGWGRDPGLVTSGELAGRLGVSERHARRLAAAAGITSAGRGLWLAEDVAALVAAHRSEAARGRRDGRWQDEGRR